MRLSISCISLLSVSPRFHCPVIVLRHLHHCHMLRGPFPPRVLVKLHPVQRLLHSLRVTVQSVQAGVHILRTKAQAAYGLGVNIWQLGKSSGGQYKYTICPLPQGLVTVL